jgi:glycerol-3-phosphate dehydrogenase
MPICRQNKLDLITADPAFDAVVVGGGINGIGVFRDLALQGLRVLLVEKGDFCSGCSSAPSRMIHGGLRYLENAEVGLVRESLQERDRLLQNAPHMVRPLPTVIPISHVFSGIANAALGLFGFTGRPRPRGALPIKIGLVLYDAITGRHRKLPRHRFMGRGAAHARWPALPPGILAAATYHDAWISYPERLGIELINDAITASRQALALNHAEIRMEAGRLLLRDAPTGARIEVAAKVIVNATGAWVDQAAETLGARLQSRMVSGTKGSHLILDNPALIQALGGHMAYFEHGDGRVCIVFPYLGRVLAGSTDLRVSAPGRTACTTEERDYILGALSALFPTIPITPDQIVYSYSGIRPLPFSDADFTGRISRGHSLRRLDGPIPQIGMIGGKWTTYRAFAEEAADLALKELGRNRLHTTRDLRIGGGAGFDATTRDRLAAEFRLGAERANHLVDLYGAGAFSVARFCAEGPDAALPGTQLTGREVIRFLREEHALRLADVLQRRSPCAIRGELSLPLIDAVSRIMAQELGWSDTERAQETARFLDDLNTFHGVSLTPQTGA